MKIRILAWVTLTFLAFALPFRLTAQNQVHDDKHHRYRFIDIGTLGGPVSYVSGGQGNLLLNNMGIVGGSADISVPDPNAPDCLNLDCFLAHAFRWTDGKLTDLGAVSGPKQQHCQRDQLTWMDRWFLA